MLKLHLLETSRSSRIIWLLEALGLEYELVRHKRGADRRSQADLFAVHPLGKGPTIVDGDLVLVESSAILRYISERYGQSRFMPPAASNARATHDQWLEYPESSLMMPLMFKLLGLYGGGLPPVLEHFAEPELKKALDFITAGVADKPFLVGTELTLADIQMSYSLAMLETGGFLRDYPELRAYWQRLQNERGYKRTVEIGGPLVPT